MPDYPDDALRDAILRKVGQLPPASLPLLDMYLDLLAGRASGASNCDTAPGSRPAPRPPINPDAQPDKSWPRAPLHKIAEHGTYFVTASTLHGAHHFRSKSRLTHFESQLLEFAANHGWNLEAWAVFSNHYHFVASAEQDASTLKEFLQALHSELARWLNHLEQSPGRQVFHNYRDTLLTFDKSYFARLNYTHQNAVKHGLVRVANHYPWCSASWLERTATPAQVTTIYSFRTDRVQVQDDFKPILDDD